MNLTPIAASNRGKHGLFLNVFLKEVSKNALPGIFTIHRLTTENFQKCQEGGGNGFKKWGSTARESLQARILEENNVTVYVGSCQNTVTMDHEGGSKRALH